MTMSDRDRFDYDWLVIGSGFGGSVAALRLAEKGYRVGVLECGRRYADEDFAKTSWQMRRYYWMPKLGLKGIFRLTMFKDVFVASGCGVGGGSLGYANTLYRARPAFYGDRQWADLADWERELAAHYDAAERMLGVTTYDEDSAADLLLKEYADEYGFGDTYAKTRVGVFLENPGQTVPDPYFGVAATTPRTPWSRTTCTSPSAWASRSSPSARSSTSARAVRPTAPTATSSRTSARAHGCGAIAGG